MAQQASSSSAERINSEMGWLKDNKSNSLGHDNLKVIEFCHHNLRLVRKIVDAKDEPTVILWDSVVEDSDDEPLE